MRNKLLAVILVLSLLLAGCNQEDVNNQDANSEAMEPAVSTVETSAESISEDTDVLFSVEVTELYQSQPLMMEMLVNEDCQIEEENDILAIYTPQGGASIAVSFIPGIQNLEATAQLLPAILQESLGAETDNVTDGYLFGARAKLCTFDYTAQDGSQTAGVYAAAVVNQSLYMIQVLFYENCTDNEAALITNVLSSMNVLRPIVVDAEAKTAKYESRYPEAKPAKAAQKTYTPVTNWMYLPYYYYGWDNGFDWDAYDSYFYEPDWNYYSDGSYWSWGWDEYNDWSFYDEYSAWYDEEYYEDQGDYFYDYDPWSDPGDYYDDGYDVYSDPGDNYDEWSDPGDYYDDGYDVYSDPGDNYDEWSDPGDYYDDGYDAYSDPGDNYDEWSDPGDYGDW